MTPLLVMPTGAVVEPVGEHVGEVAQTTDTARCHHTAQCLTPLLVGDLVVKVGQFYALLDHAAEHPVYPTATGTPRLSDAAGGVPRRL